MISFHKELSFFMIDSASMSESCLAINRKEILSWNIQNVFNLPKPRAMSKFDLNLRSIVCGFAIVKITRSIMVLQILTVFLSFVVKDGINLLRIYRSSMFI